MKKKSYGNKESGTTSNFDPPLQALIESYSLIHSAAFEGCGGQSKLIHAPLRVQKRQDKDQREDPADID